MVTVSNSVVKTLAPFKDYATFVDMNVMHIPAYIMSTSQFFSTSVNVL